MSDLQPRSRYVQLATGLRYHLLEWGDAASADETVFLIHGFLDLGAGWAPMARAGFAADRHVVAPDMRGHGDSDRIGAGGYYHFADYLADLDALLEHFPDRPIALVGHSMGGSIASYFTGAFPRRVRKLVLMEGMGPPERSDTSVQRIVTWIDGWRRVRDKQRRQFATVEDAAARLRQHDALLSDELALELAAAGTRPTESGELVFKHDPLHATMGPTPFRVEQAAELWANIGCPVLAVEGDKSSFRFLAAEAERRYAHISDLRRATLSDAGHMMQRHQPAALAELLARFLSEP